MDRDAAIEALEAAGLTIVDNRRNNNDTGWCLKTSEGALINVYDTGRVVVQGKNTDKAKDALGVAQTVTTPVKAWPKAQKEKNCLARKVFVIYGHDSAARTEVEAMLRRWDLEPLILDQLPSGGQTIIEKLESVRKEARFAVVLATPDDEGHLKGRPAENAFRARQNVVLELGMMLAVLGRPRVAILLKSDPKMERPSDIQGLIYVAYKENVNEAKLTLAQEINNQGIAIDLSKV